MGVLGEDAFGGVDFDDSGAIHSRPLHESITAGYFAGCPDNKHQVAGR